MIVVATNVRVVTTTILLVIEDDVFVLFRCFTRENTVVNFNSVAY